MAALLDRFVCVRLIQAYGLDLSLFQYDNQLTWSVFFLNADRTIYGRYGTRSGQQAANDVSMQGFSATAERALELHGRFAAVKAALAAKTGPAPRWATPEQIPPLASYKKGDTSRQGCIHCHKIHTAELTAKRNAGEPLTDRDLWDFPLPGTVGLTLDVNSAATVQQVAADSPAERAGFKTGDELLEVAGQPLISSADMQWVLQHTPDTATVRTVVLRAGAKKDLTLSLQPGWRRNGPFAWKAVGWALGNRVLGFRCAPVPDAERENLVLPPGALALKVSNIIPDWVKDGNHAIRKTGLQKNDIIVAVDGAATLTNESLLQAYAFQQKKTGEPLVLSVRRGAQTLDIKVPIGK